MTYTSSFSKTVAPGVRTGYFVLPEAHAAAFEERAVSTYITPPFLPQAIVAEFVSRGRFEPNLERVRGELRARRDAMLGRSQLARAERIVLEHSRRAATSSGSSWTEWTTTPLASAAEREGVTFVAGRGFFAPASPDGETSARLAFSYETPDRITEGIERIMRLLDG